MYKLALKNNNLIVSINHIKNLKEVPYKDLLTWKFLSGLFNVKVNSNNLESFLKVIIEITFDRWI